MTKEEVKKTAEELLVKTVDYILMTDISYNEKCELFVEFACSLLTLSVDANQSKEDIVDELMDKIGNMSVICLGALLDYKNGILTNIKKEYGGDKC